MPPKRNVGRPMLPLTADQELNERRRYFREWNRKRRKENLALAKEAKTNHHLKNKFKDKKDKCTKLVAETKKTD